MRCKSCNYPLWHIRPRQCPECGTGFKPSEFDFVLNSVRFCCPHCDQDFYGTGEKGHLLPRTFACVRCQKVIDMDEMVLLPTAGVEEKQTETTVVPWVERRTRSWFTSFFITMGMALANPRRVINAIPEQSSLQRAMLYGGLHITLQLVCNLVAVFIFGAIMSVASGRGVGLYMGILATIIGFLFAGPLFILIWAATAHATLRLTGPTEFGFKRTVHAIAYSAGNNFLLGIPCFGMYLWWAAALWWAITGGFMLAAAQKVKGWRAALAIVVLPLAVVLVLGGSIAYLIYRDQTATATAMSASSNPSPPPAMSSLLAKKRLQPFAVEFQRSLETNAPMFTHIAERMQVGMISPGAFIDPAEAANGNTVWTSSIGGIPLAMWSPGVSTKTKSPRIDKAIAALPSGPAYRVADCVFTHAGVDGAMFTQLNTGSKLWLMIAWRRSLTSAAPSEMVSVVLGDGSIITLLSDEIEDELESQNTLRSSLGLPPLPLPEDVKEHEKPALDR